MVVMISQPMAGKSEKQIKIEREYLVNKLQKQGYKVMDTIFTEEAPKGCNAGIWYLAKSIEAMSFADAVLFMNGWDTARGCKIEFEIAKEYGKTIMIEERRKKK